MARSIYSSPKTPAHLRRVLGTIDTEATTEFASQADLTAAIDGVNTFDATADSALTQAQIVYVTAAGNVDLVDPTDDTASIVAGAATENVTISTSGTIRTVGIVTRAGWSLTPGVVYYASKATLGEVVATPDVSLTGEWLIPVGVALSATSLLLLPKQRIRLG